MRSNSGTPDWCDGAAYAPLLGADRSLFAWEWLRRDPAYRSAAAAAALLEARTDAASPDARRWGLVTFEPPDLTVPDAKPLWRSDHCPYVLSAEPHVATSPDDLVDLRRLEGIARGVRGEHSDHLLFSDGLRTIRLDAPPGLLENGPAGLGYRIAGLATARAQLMALRRWVALCLAGRFSSELHRREVRAARWILMLRAHDAMVARANQREIAERLISPIALQRRRISEPSVRSRVQRLVRSARRLRMADGSSFFNRGRFRVPPRCDGPCTFAALRLPRRASGPTSVR
jgi:hypothetical protein